ncbi:hypothetical protein [Marinospirillum insulare]|uniref:Uncharacterized protein n=1 Tax=Marinospirillum insulare TaxID=217169 RepID=A0ABQ5ZZE8_9GAMM|nr:hypothetical protein [Marinospirillum insulare]GLR64673.1 hypothetical protein GCM10007878_21110 [Marinospirillum insulare]
MVSVKILSQYQEGFTPEKLEGRSRKISKGPLYCLTKVSKLLSKNAENAINLATKSSRRDTASLSWDKSDVAQHLKQAIKKPGNYLGSEWAKLSEKACAACDVYRLTTLKCEYYFKFAIHKNGSLVLVISCHLSR